MDIFDVSSVNSKNFVDNKASELASTLSWISDKVRYISRVKNLVEGSPLRIIDDQRLDFIIEQMKEVNDKVYMFGRSTSQVSRKLQTLSMLFPAGATYRVLAQILAQIEHCQSAIVENVVNLRKKIRIAAINQDRIEELKRKKQSSKSKKLTYKEELELARLESDTEKLAIGIANLLPYLEASIKEIGFLVESYNQVKSNKGIPDDWTEKDFEEAEFQAHVMGAFRNAVRDFLSSGRPNWSTCEWWEQLGISPFEGCMEVEKFFSSIDEKETIDYDSYCNWLEEMSIKYKDRYKLACKRTGLDPQLVSRLFTVGIDSDGNKPQLEVKDGVQTSGKDV